MPKLPRVSGSEAVRALERLGFVRARQKGQSCRAAAETVGCVVPLHPELKVGTLASVLRQAQVTPEEFLGALCMYRLTAPSSGRSKGRFAPFAAPLMSNYKGFPSRSSDSRR